MVIKEKYISVKREIYGYEWDSSNVSKVGGKAAQLRKITPDLVPNWVVITADCPDDVLSEVVQEAVSLLSLPPHSPQKYSVYPYGKYAVRSSAVEEDGTNQSFAGIFESKLNVPITGLEHAVREVRDSVKDERVTSYVDTMMKISSKYPRPSELPQTPAVIMMHMVDAKYSGVLFTTEPVEGTDRMLVEYEEGVGGVVDGKSNSKMLFLENDSDSNKRTAAELNVNDLTQFYPIYIEAKRLENNYRKPLDIEWAIDKNNQPWILQVRPITAGIAV